jgi:flagellar biosynthesis/type III secretory pathway protein FliH
MSSSPRQAPAAGCDSSAAPATEEPSAFPYREVTGPLRGAASGQLTPFGFRPDAPSAPSQPEALAQAREHGRQQGFTEARAKFDEQLAGERAAMAAALAQFTRERAAYYRKVEEEAVELALSIARKVLHREAQVDPLLLMGIVRVALERIEGATGVVLAVAPQQSAEWQRYLGSRMNPEDLPQIVEDPAMAPDRCELRTSMGIAQMGVEVQLKEIEQGLMDLLAARPQEGQ